MKYTVSIFATLMALSTPAFAQDAASGWSGEGSASASSTTGNTETTDFGLGLNLAKEVGLWKYKTEALADFGKTAGIETRNTFFLAGKACLSATRTFAPHLDNQALTARAIFCVHT